MSSTLASSLMLRVIVLSVWRRFSSPAAQIASLILSSAFSLVDPMVRLAHIPCSSPQSHSSTSLFGK